MSFNKIQCLCAVTIKNTYFVHEYAIKINKILIVLKIMLNNDKSCLLQIPIFRKIIGQINFFTKKNYGTFLNLLCISGNNFSVLNT